MLRSEFGHVWLLITGLFTEIAVCKFLHGLARNLFILSIVCVYTFFSASFCMAHCALDFARDHAP